MWSAIYTRGSLPRILVIFSVLFFFFPSMCPFSSHASVSRKNTLNKHAYMFVQHEPICHKETCVYGVIAGRRIRGIELYRRQ